MLKNIKIAHGINEDKFFKFRQLKIILTYLCNFNCYYCPYRYTNSKHIIKKLSNNIVFINITKVINFLKILDSVYKGPPIYVRLLGGEPTLHPRLIQLIEELNKYDFINEIILGTNVSKSKYYYKQILQMSKKNKIEFSYHPSNYTIDYYVDLFKYLINNNFEKQITVNFDFDTNNKNIYNIYNTFYNILKLKINVNNINGFKYTDKDKQFLNKVRNKRNLIFKITYEDNNYDYILHDDILELDYNPFKNMYCTSFNKRWIIDPLLYIRPDCYSEDINFYNKYKCYNYNDVKNFLYEIEHKYFKCSEDTCYCHIEDYKWR
jgi:organic radical activating enzyme